MLMLKPTKVLKSFRMFWVLTKSVSVHIQGGWDIALELVDMADLIPTICAGKRGRGISSYYDLVKVPESLIKVLLLLIDDSDAKTYLIGSLKVWGDGEDGQKGFEGVIKTAIPVIQETNAIPKVRISGVRKMAEGTLIGLIGLLEIVGHNVAVGQDGPCLSAGGVCGNSALEVGDGLWVAFFLGKDGSGLGHSADVCGVDG